ncbi:MAG: GNAT family N-acetyltransferase [Aeromicrobium erythreum]
MRIRPARPDDEADLLRVEQETWTTASSPVAPPVWDGTQAFFRPDRGPAGFVVAEVDGSVVGYVALHQVMDVPAHQHVLTIDGLGVRADARGHGIGRALVAAAVEVARTRGARRVTLRVLGPNLAARRVYEQCGFEGEGEGVQAEEFLLDGRLVDDVLMARRLVGP